MKAKLIGVSGEPQPSDIELVLPSVVGRSRRSGVLIQYSHVSRQHCELYEQNGKLMCRDLGSMNGTCVNHVRIEDPIELLSGDLLTVGSVTFRVDCADNPATLSDNKDETEIASREMDLDQLLKLPEEASASSDKSFESQVVVSTPAAEDASHPTVDIGQTGNPIESEKRSDPYVRNPR